MTELSARILRSHAIGLHEVGKTCSLVRCAAEIDAVLRTGEHDVDVTDAAFVQWRAMIAFASQDLGLRPAQWKAVARRAMQAGKTTPEYLRLLIEQDLLAGRTFDDILRPIRRDFRRGGVTEAKLDLIVSRARRGRAGTRQKAARRPKRETPQR